MIRARGNFLSQYQPYYVHQDHQFFLIHKSSDGLNAGIANDNFAWKRHYEETRKAELLAGCHYLRSGINTKEQVNTYLDSIRGYDVDFHVVDFEEKYNTPSKQFAESPFIFMDEVEDITEQSCWLYSRSNIIQAWMFLYGVYKAREIENLYLAQYPYRGWNDRMLEVPDTSFGWETRTPAGCKDWGIWQYNADGNQRGPFEGVTGDPWQGIISVCLEVFNGSEDEMRERIKKETAPIPDPDPDPCEFPIIVEDGKYRVDVNKI